MRNFLKRETLLEWDAVKQSSVTTQNWISLNRRRNTCKSKNILFHIFYNFPTFMNAKIYETYVQIGCYFAKMVTPEGLINQLVLKHIKIHSRLHLFHFSTLVSTLERWQNGFFFERWMAIFTHDNWHWHPLHLYDTRTWVWKWSGKYTGPRYVPREHI